MLKTVINLIFPITIIVLISTTTSLAQTSNNNNDDFLIKNVQVNVNNSNAVTAKQIGFEKAHNIAYQKLIKKIIPQHLQQKISKPNIKQISNLVRDITFLEEKSGENLYFARFNVRFHQQKTIDFFKSFNIKINPNNSKNILVIPLYQEAGKTRLWENNNFWLNAWYKHNNSLVGGIKIIIPEGSLEDMNTVSILDAKSINEKKLYALAQKYSADEFLLSFSSITPDVRNNSFLLSFQVIPFIVGVRPKNEKFTLTAKSLSEVPTKMQNASTRVISLIQQQLHSNLIKEESVNTFASSQKYWLVSEHKNINGVETLNQRLSSISEFSDLKILAANSKKLLFSLNTRHNSRQIINILDKYLIDAKTNTNNPYLLTISLRGQSQ